MDDKSKIYSVTSRALQGALLLLALCAPISIAATQIAWSFALLFWIIKSVFVRQSTQRDWMSLAMLAFVGLTLISSIFSYEPEVSLRKMVGVSLVTIVYLFAGNIGDAKMVRKAVVIMLIAAGFTAVWTIGRTAIGENLKVKQLAADSPLRSAGVFENDTIQKANGKSVASPDQLADAVNASPDGAAKLQIYRYENILYFEVPAASLLQAPDNSGKLGIAEWSRGRDTRAAGFYGGAYMTYSEATQLIASIALGLLILIPGGYFSRNRVLLALSIGAFCVALFLTVTRASWAGFLISAAVIVLFGASRKAILICVLCAIPVAFAGIYYVQQKRNISLTQPTDASTEWRLMVWREGLGVLTSSPRHMAVGIGMDSLKTHWQDWHMFDNGWQPIGHMHNTALAIAFERGIPTLVAWLIWMALYLRMLWRGIRRRDLDRFERGVLLGAFGGAIGFLSAGIVHFNWGDSEVVMIFYLIMGLSMAILRRPPEPSAEPF